MSCDYLVSINFWLKKKYMLQITEILANLMYFAILKPKKCVNLNLIKDLVCIDNMIVFLNFKHVFYFQK